MLSWLVLNATLVGATEVRSDTDCPSADDVAAELVGLSSGDSAPGRLEIHGPSPLKVEWWSGGVKVAERQLSRGSSCHAHAQTIAVIMTTWQAKFRSSATLEADELLLPAVETSAVGPAVSQATATASPRRESVRFDIAAALVGALSGIDFSPGARIDATLAPPHLPVAARITLAVTGPRTLFFAGGSSDWIRAFMAVGPAYQVAAPHSRFDFHLEGLLAVLSVSGQGFVASTGRAYNFDPGIGGGVRALMPVGKWGPFLDLSVVGWPRRQALVVLGSAATTHVPQFDLLFSIGIAAGDFGRPAQPSAGDPQGPPVKGQKP